MQTCHNQNEEVWYCVVLCDYALHDCGDRPENFFRGASHVGCDASQQCGLVKVASPGVRLATNHRIGPLTDRILDQAVNLKERIIIHSECYRWNVPCPQ